MKNIVCTCGKEKDYRSRRCAECSGRSYPKNRVYSVSDEEIVQEIENSETYLEVAQKLSISRKRVAYIVQKYDLSTGHMRATSHRDQDPETILCKGSHRRNGPVKKYVLKHRLLEYKCPCGIGDSWNGVPLTLELDHINGVATDNSLENLRFLCPNCHSQTPTNKGKNSRRIRG